MNLEDSATKTAILVVDDDRTTRTLLTSFLERAGHRVITAADGAEALGAFRRRPDRIVLLLSDVTMPRMGGLQLADAVLAMRPNLPVVFISGNVPNADRGWGCIVKPFTSGQLVERVREVLAVEKDRASQDVGGQPERSRLAAMTKRQKEVLELICEGFSTKAIAQKLWDIVQDCRHTPRQPHGKGGRTQHRPPGPLCDSSRLHRSLKADMAAALLRDSLSDATVRRGVIFF